MDYLFRWLELRFLKAEQVSPFAFPKVAPMKPEPASTVAQLGEVVILGDAPVCQFCGALMGEKRFVLSVAGVWQPERLLMMESNGSAIWQRA